MRENSPLTRERLEEVLGYDQTTGRFTWRTGRYAGKQAAAGRMTSVRIDGVRYGAARLAWFYVHKTWPEFHISFKNGATDDLRISNLRLKTLPDVLTDKSWRAMHTRCYRPEFIAYDSYGDVAQSAPKRYM